MSLGLLQQSLHVSGVVKSLQIVPYLLVWERWSLPGLRFEAHDPWSWVVCFFLVDFAYYWYHRMGHEINCFWAAHVAHHSSEEYNLTTALRQGAIQYAAAFLFYAPVGLLIAPEVFSFHAHFNRLFQFWIHTRAIDKMPSWFEYVFNTPSHHRVHHACNAVYIDRNYGGTLILFDRLFGTFQAELPDQPCVFGLTHNIASFNPLWANLHHWVYMWQLAAQQPSWGARFSVLWVGPGWSPEGPLPIPDAYKAPPKYDAFALTRAGMGYAVALFLHALAALKYLTLHPSLTSSLTDPLWILQICAALLSLSALIQGATWFRSTEIARLLVLSSLLYTQLASPILALFVFSHIFLVIILPLQTTKISSH